MTARRSLFRAVLLPSGKVLITGGCEEDQELASTELFDPARGAFVPSVPMATARGSHTATLLPDGNVLVTGQGSPNAELCWNSPSPARSGTSNRSQTIGLMGEPRPSADDPDHSD